MPENHLINCQDIGSIGVWLEMSGVSDVDIRLQAAYNSNTSAFFDLPTIEINSGNFLLKPQQFKIPGPGLVNLVHSFPLADVVNYVKIQVKGTGTINKATLTHKFRPTR